MPAKKSKVSLKSLRHLPSVRAILKRLSARAIALADEIGELAEPPMREVESSRRLEEFLKANGFKVTRRYRDLPTAFRAELGVARPTIAILAEYDALPDCGQRPGRWGHGCGHNLLGVGSAVAAVATRQVLAKIGRDARIIVFGCPAEEVLGGKVFMARLRAFAGLDAVLAWHPGGTTFSNPSGGSAMDSIQFTFRGRTAHAAGGPHEGRSALDAAVLTDVAANYLREHVEENARIHSVVTEGGSAPNVVPDRATIWYYIRGKDRKQVDDLRRRIRLCAAGAAMATETRWRMAVQTAITERIGNAPMAEMLDALLHRCGPPRFTGGEARAAGRVLRGKKYTRQIDPIRANQTRGSSDEDNVSWFAPLGAVTVACVPKGTTGHHRLYARMSRLPGAHRGMLKAAEVLAMAAVELALNAPLLRKARADFRKQRRGKKYSLPVTSGILAPVWKQ